MGLLDLVTPLIGDSGSSSELRPAFHRSLNFFQNRRSAPALHERRAGALHEVFPREAIPLPVQGHLVGTGPRARRIEAVGHIKSRCEGPLTEWVHQEREKGSVLDIDT